jgi:hypothetical protein
MQMKSFKSFIEEQDAGGEKLSVKLIGRKPPKKSGKQLSGNQDNNVSQPSVSDLSSGI